MQLLIFISRGQNYLTIQKQAPLQLKMSSTMNEWEANLKDKWVTSIAIKTQQIINPPSFLQNKQTNKKTKQNDNRKKELDHQKSFFQKYSQLLNLWDSQPRWDNLLTGGLWATKPINLAFVEVR